MNRYVIILLILMIIGCSDRPKRRNDASDNVTIFHKPLINDSLYQFIHSIDSFPNSSLRPEYLVQFKEDEDGCVLILLSANENISPSRILNTLPYEINNYSYHVKGGVIIDGRPILVRLVDDVDISTILDTSYLDITIGNMIDSVVVPTNIEPYRIATYKLYLIDKQDSLILLQDCYLGKRNIDKKRPDFYW